MKCESKSLDLRVHGIDNQCYRLYAPELWQKVVPEMQVQDKEGEGTAGGDPGKSKYRRYSLVLGVFAPAISQSRDSTRILLHP